MSESAALTLLDVVAGRAADADGFVRMDIDAAAWSGLAHGCAAGRQDLIALWHDHGRVRMALMAPAERLRTIVSIATEGGAYPSVGAVHAPAIRLERTMRDLYGTDPVGLPDRRPWLDHGRWPGRPGGPPASYPFLAAMGESLHQIPVGPVHAGIIEPGHFRFHANGEAVVRLEERLGYVHKGVEALCSRADIAKAGAIVARISGDSTVAYGLAFARAVEAALGWQPPPRALALRGVMAELERISHHVNDVGAICNDASVVAIMARCTLIREDVLQTVDRTFGHRMMMDRIVPGGVAVGIDTAGVAALRDLLLRVERGLSTVGKVYDRSPSLQDRTVTTGRVAKELVDRFAAGGHVGRGSGRGFDARKAFPYPPYDGVDFVVPVHTEGDVDARLWVRIDEVGQSVRIIRQLLDSLPAGPIATPGPAPHAGEGAAQVEAFRGDAFVSVRLDAAGQVAQLHARDASVFQWPLLEVAIEGNIVADFPLCNKSFNCSYSGHDI